MTKESLLEQKRENAIKAKQILTSPDGSTEEAQKFIDANLEIDKKLELFDAVEDIPVKSAETKAMENTGRVEFKAGTYLNQDLPFSGTRQEKEYKAYTFGKYLQANSFGNQEAKSWLKNNGHLKANNEGTSTAGGLLTPDIVLPDLIMLRDTYGVVRREAYKVPMQSDVQVVPNLTGDGTTVWGVENTANTAYDLTFANVGLTAKKLNAYNIFSTELRDDAVIDYAAAAAKSLMFSLAKEEDRVFFKGNSINATDGNIDGIFQSVIKVDATLANIAGLVIAPVGSINTPANLTVATYRLMVSKLPQYALNAKWYVSKAYFYTRMANLGDALAGNAIGDYANYWGPNPMFLGYPVVFVQNLDPDLTANNPICCLADLSVGVCLGDRMTMEIGQSDQVKYMEDSIVIRAKERVAFNAFDKGNASATAASRVAGSLIVLAAAAT